MHFNLFLLGALLALPAAAAGSFPSKPVRIIVPYPISGPSDIQGTPRLSRTDRIIARNAPPSISDALAEIAAYAIQAETSQPVMIERLPGAATVRGANAVARAPADGHALLLASNSTIVINPSYLQGIGYDPERDFSPVAPLATMPFVLVARAGLPRTIRDLVAWLRQRPGKIDYGSSGEGSTGNLVGELFRRSARVDIVHASFNGGVEALNGLVQGQVALALVAAPVALGHPSRYYRPLAVSGRKRLEHLHDLPTFAESGLPGVEAEGWYAIFVRSGASAAAMTWLGNRIDSTLREPATRERILALGLEPAAMTVERFAARIQAERAGWAPVLRESLLSWQKDRDG